MKLRKSDENKTLVFKSEREWPMKSKQKFEEIVKIVL